VSSDSILTMAAVVGEIVVLVPTIRRRVWRILPIFSAYLVWALLSDLTWLYFQEHGNPLNYLRFYTIEMTIDSLLMFTVLVELAWSVLRPVRASLPRGTLFALAVLIAIAGLIIWPLAGKTTPPQMGDEGATIFHLQQTFAILRVTCFVVMASFSQLLSIGWRDRELQVATGLGVYSIASLLVNMLHAHQLSGANYHKLDEVVSLSYLGTLAYWVVSFAAKEYQRKEFSPQMRDFLLLMGGGARKP
jgi:hypothetical protein